MECDKDLNLTLELSSSVFESNDLETHKPASSIQRLVSLSLYSCFFIFLFFFIESLFYLFNFKEKFQNL
jgi:hypothetical protein